MTKLMTSYIVMETAKVSKVSSSERLLKKLQNCIEQRKVSSGEVCAAVAENNSCTTRSRSFFQFTVSYVR